MILDWGGLQAKIQVIIVIKDGLKYALSEIVEFDGRLCETTIKSNSNNKSTCTFKNNFETNNLTLAVLKLFYSSLIYSLY